MQMAMPVWIMLTGYNGLRKEVAIAIVVPIGPMRWPEGVTTARTIHFGIALLRKVVPFVRQRLHLTVQR